MKFYRWINPLLWKAYRSEIGLTDIYACPKPEESARTAAQVQR